MILFICRDLMFVSRVQQAAQAAAVPLTSRSSLAQATQWLQANAASSDKPSANASEDLPAGSPPPSRQTVGGELRGVMVDLKSISQPTELTSFLGLVREHHPGCAALAFGPHVKTELLQSAQDAGFDPVLTQGQFDRSMAVWLREWSGDDRK